MINGKKHVAEFILDKTELPKADVILPLKRKTTLDFS